MLVTDRDRDPKPSWQQSHSKSQSAVAEVTPGQVTKGQLRFAAMSLLARREHSRFELRQKLSQQFRHHADLDEVLQQLADEALQSDSRFAENFVAMRVRKGLGPVKIEKELEQRRIGPEVISQSMKPYVNQWEDLARAAWRKKFSRSVATPDTKSPKTKPPNTRLASELSSPTEMAKQVRFLLYRGFTNEQVQNLLKGN